MIAKFLTESTRVMKNPLSFLSKFTFEREFKQRFFPLKNSIILTDGLPGNWFRIDDVDGGDIVLSMKQDGRRGSGKNYIVFLSYSGEKDNELLITDAAPTSVTHALESDEAEEASRYTRELVDEMSNWNVTKILDKMERLHDRWDRK